MNSSSDWIALLSAIATAGGTCFAGLAVLFAAGTILYSVIERRIDMKEDFVLWAIERLRQDDLRQYRKMIFLLSDADIQTLAQLVQARQPDARLDQIRQVCLAFDEIGYFVYKVGIVNFRDILDMYSQTVKIWNKVAPIVAGWREIEGATSFAYFEMLARQEKFQVTPKFEPPSKLYK